MKTLVILIMLIGLFLIPAAQDIDPQLYGKTWLDNETRLFNGYAVTKMFGYYPNRPSVYNVYPITAVSYKDLESLKEELDKKAQAENWSESELTEARRDLEFAARGGEIQVYISRYDEENANFRWFFIVLRGADDKGKLWEEEIGYQAPEVPYERGWWNYTTIQVPMDIELPFYIYLNDKHSEVLSDFKFRVEKAATVGPASGE